LSSEFYSGLDALFPRRANFESADVAQGPLSTQLEEPGWARDWGILEQSAGGWTATRQIDKGSSKQCAIWAHISEKNKLPPTWPLGELGKALGWLGKGQLNAGLNRIRACPGRIFLASPLPLCV